MGLAGSEDSTRVHSADYIFFASASQQNASILQQHKTNGLNRHQNISNSDNPEKNLRSAFVWIRQGLELSVPRGWFLLALRMIKELRLSVPEQVWVWPGMIEVECRRPSKGKGGWLWTSLAGQGRSFYCLFWQSLHISLPEVRIYRLALVVGGKSLSRSRMLLMRGIAPKDESIVSTQMRPRLRGPTRTYRLRHPRLCAWVKNVPVYTEYAFCVIAFG